MSTRRLLVVDHDPAALDYLSQVLRRDDRLIDGAQTIAEAVRFLKDSARDAVPDVVISGHNNNGSDPLKLLRKVRAVRPDTRVIVTGGLDPPAVISAIRDRAYCYFHEPAPAAALNDMVQQALDATSWKDDIRVISARPEWISLDVRCKMDAVERVVQFIREITADLSAQVREDVGGAFRELLMNAVEHGAKSDARKRARVALLRTERSVIAHIHDPGKGFSLDSLPHAAISNPADSPIQHIEVRVGQGQRPGGFGILMTRNLVDELLYNERGNAVLFVKYLK